MASSAPQQRRLGKKRPNADGPVTSSKKKKQTQTQTQTETDTDVMVSMMAEAGCTLNQPGSLSFTPADLHNIQRRLEMRFQADPSLVHKFLSGLSSFIGDPSNLRRILISASDDGEGDFLSSDSIARVLLLVTPLQTQFFEMLLEKLPEHFDEISPSIKNDIARLILNQFRWLDFLVDSELSTKKLLEILSICPLALKKEIIGILPEIVGEQNNETVVSFLEQMLQEDSNLIAPILDAFNSINLQDDLFEQAVTVAISSLRTVAAESLPVVIKFLLQCATTTNAKRIVEQIRENLHFPAFLDIYDHQNKKLKGKMRASNSESLVLDAIKNGLRFHNFLGETFLKEISGLDSEREHKVIDLLVLLIIYSNGGLVRRKAERLLQRKALCGHFTEKLLQHCIEGRGETLQAYFRDILSLCNSFLSHKNQGIRNLGIYAYVLVYKEFSGTYHRQEVLGSLVTHTGSGVQYEVDSALDSLVLLATRHSLELLPVSSYINGILDYLEGFQDDQLHKVYKIFSELAILVWCEPTSCNSSIGNELLIIVRKQISNPDKKYKRMGIIGAVKLVASLRTTNTTLSEGSLQIEASESIFSLLQMVMDTCKLLPLEQTFLYDELAELVKFSELHPTVIEWISKHTGEFENIYLLDLEDGCIHGEVGDCGGLIGELWMNLDGEVSPICLNILPSVASHQRCSQALQFLPSYFSLLGSVERLTNQGSLGSIDALLGCPFYLPEHKLLSVDRWETLLEAQKQIICLSLYYAANWIRELLNAFSTQISDQVESLTQVTREEIIVKLLKRMRNLLFLEHLLNTCLKSYNFPLPQLHSFTDNCAVAQSDGGHLNKIAAKKRGRKTNDSDLKGMSDRHKSQSMGSRSSQNGSSASGPKQPLITSFMSKIAKESSQSPSQQTLSSLSKSQTEDRSENYNAGTVHNNGCDSSDLSAIPEQLEMQRFKFRPLNLSTLSIMSLSQHTGTCCVDPAAELPLHLYLIRDFCYKLDSLEYLRKPFAALLTNTYKAPSGLRNMTVFEFLEKAKPLFPTLRRHLDCAVKILTEDCQLYSEHWATESLSSGNPPAMEIIASGASAAEATFKEILNCVYKIFSIQGFFNHTPILKALLEAFQTTDAVDDISSAPNMCNSAGSLEFLFRSSFAYLNGLFDNVSSMSFLSVSAILLTLKAMVNCIEAFVEKNSESKRRQSSIDSMVKLIPKLHSRLSALACKLLHHDIENSSDGKTSKAKGDVLQQVLQIYIRSNETPVACLEEIACKIMPQLPARKTRSQLEVSDFPSLSCSMLLVWYRVQLEEVLSLLSKVIKEMTMLQRSKTTASRENVDKLLASAHQCVNVVVSLMNLTKTHNKVTMHAMAVKYGGKFVDTFLKGFDFLQIHYDSHKNSIVILVKELQKATRTIQTLCNDAKGFKRTVVTSKVPAVKRSMERYLFCVKALLHSTSHGDSFWMGNLKHKDLQGREVSSQLPVSDDEDNEPLNSLNEEDDGDHGDDNNGDVDEEDNNESDSNTRLDDD